jgi:multimeric flavodoxin WrbA
MSGMGMRVLGLCAGSPGGSAEILLRVALDAAAAAVPGAPGGARADLVRLGDVSLPQRPAAPGELPAGDDGPWLWDQLMDSDGLIVATPIHSRTIPGTLKLAADRLAGPAADVAFAESYRQMLAAGQVPPVAFPYDERVFRPRVAGFLAVGGAVATQWHTLALPLLHQMTFSAHIAVVDQALVTGAGMPRSVVLDDAALAAASRVGHSVGTQLGVAFDDAQYRGEPGLCPLCHLSVVTIDGAAAQCATCGAQGRLAVQDGAARVRFDDPAGLDRSVISLAEKRAHFREVQETAAAQGALAGEIARLAAEYEGPGRVITPPR